MGRIGPELLPRGQIIESHLPLQFCQYLVVLIHDMLEKIGQDLFSSGN
jgi:hypothetical protein